MSANNSSPLCRTERGVLCPLQILSKGKIHDHTQIRSPRETGRVIFSCSFQADSLTEHFLICSQTLMIYATWKGHKSQSTLYLPPPPPPPDTVECRNCKDQLPLSAATSVAEGVGRQWVHTHRWRPGNLGSQSFLTLGPPWLFV